MANGVNTAGFTGTVNDERWARLIPRAGTAIYGVAAAGDCKVTVTTGDRTVRVARTEAGTGGCWGWGVFCDFTADTTLQLAAASGSRWDLIALRRNWASRTVTPVVVQGTATRGIPGRRTAPGTEDDQPLALVRVNGSSIAEVVDLRCWAGNGGIFAVDELALNYLEAVGSVVTIGNTKFIRKLNSTSNPIWFKTADGHAIVSSADKWMAGAIPIATSADSNTVTVARITFADPGFPYHVFAHAMIEGGGTAGTRWDARIEIAGQPRLALERGDIVAPWYSPAGITTRPIVGAANVDLILWRMYGSAAFGISSLNRHFRAMQIPAL